VPELDRRRFLRLLGTAALGGSAAACGQGGGRYTAADAAALEAQKEEEARRSGRGPFGPQVVRGYRGLAEYPWFELDAEGGLLLVSQFTLAADTRRGLRPGFSTAMPPEPAEALYDELVAWLRGVYPGVATGRFGAHMKVALVNDGPVTFTLRS